MRYVTIAILFATTFAHAVTFDLIDRDGGTNGPFQAIEGEVIQLGGKAYRLSPRERPETTASRKLRETVIERLNIADASPAEAVAELNRLIAAGKQPRTKPRKRSVP